MESGFLSLKIAEFYMTLFMYDKHTCSFQAFFARLRPVSVCHSDRVFLNGNEGWDEVIQGIKGDMKFRLFLISALNKGDWNSDSLFFLLKRDGFFEKMP